MSWVMDKCCFIVPLGIALKLIAVTELVISVGFMIMCTVAVISEEQSTDGKSKGELLYMVYSGCIDSLFAVYLLYGIYVNKHGYAKVWCIAQVVHLLATVFITVYSTALFKRSTPTFQEFAAFLITTGLDAYYIAVAYSYYQWKKKRSRPIEPLPE